MEMTFFLGLKALSAFQKMKDFRLEADFFPKEAKMH